MLAFFFFELIINPEILLAWLFFCVLVYCFEVKLQIQPIHFGLGDSLCEVTLMRGRTA